MRVDPSSVLAASSNPAIAFFARRNLLGERAGSVRDLWELPESLRIVRRQTSNGSWSSRQGMHHCARRRTTTKSRPTPARDPGRAVRLDSGAPGDRARRRVLLSFQTSEGDIRGIYGRQYATTYVGAITELLVKAGYADDPRIATTFDWLLAMRQSDGGWAIPMRTLGHRYRDFLDLDRQRRAPEHVAQLEVDPERGLVSGTVILR